jgi:tripartite motif-containing protein 71
MNQQLVRFLAVGLLILNSLLCPAAVLAGEATATPAAAAPEFEFLWASRGGDEPFESPYGMAVDAEGNLWVADGFRGRFQILAPDGSFLETWGETGSGEGQFDFETTFGGAPAGYGDIAFDTQGNFYVVDTGNQRIQAFTPNRAFVRSWGRKGRGEGEFISPSGIAVGPDGTVYVSDESRADVQRFDRNGRFLGTIGSFGDGDGQFVIPSAVTVDPDGDVWVTDWSKHQVQRFSPTGELLAVWGIPGSGEGQLSSPNDIAVDAAGRVFIWDDRNFRIQVFTGDGRFLTRFGGIGDEPGQFKSGAGLTLGPDATLYVGDMGRNDVQAFRIVTPGEVFAGATRS